MYFKNICPGIFYFPEFLDSKDCNNSLKTIQKNANWEKAALGKYIDNEVATSHVDLEFRDVEVSEELGMSLEIIKSKHELISKFISELGFNINQFSKYMISKYSEGSHIRPHRDTNVYNTARMFTIICYLNDDFQGGEIFFPEMSQTLKPKAGELLLFYSELLHGVKPILSGFRYCIVWFAENSNIHQNVVKVDTISQ